MYEAKGAAARIGGAVERNPDHKGQRRGDLLRSRRSGCADGYREQPDIEVQQSRVRERTERLGAISMSRPNDIGWVELAAPAHQMRCHPWGGFANRLS